MTFPRLHFPPSIKEKSQFQNETRTIREKKNPSLCFGGGKIQIKCDKRTSENSKSGNPQTCDTFIITSFRQLILGFFFLSIFNQERGLFIWEHDSLISWADFFNSFPQNPACFLLLCSNLRLMCVRCSSRFLAFPLLSVRFFCVKIRTKFPVDQWNDQQSARLPFLTHKADVVLPSSTPTGGCRSKRKPVGAGLLYTEYQRSGVWDSVVSRLQLNHSVSASPAVVAMKRTRQGSFHWSTRHLDSCVAFLHSTEVMFLSP